MIKRKRKRMKTALFIEIIIFINVLTHFYIVLIFAEVYLLDNRKSENSLYSEGKLFINITDS